MTFKNTPREIFRMIGLFNKAKLSYNLFKCEHIFEGSNKNLDILFETRSGYDKASRLLERQGYVLYLSEHVEKYKRMYALFEAGAVTRIHLHREIAWHGLIVLDKNQVFLRARMLSSAIKVPSPEDQLLIHVAHILFENFVINRYAGYLINKLLLGKINFLYVNRILNEEGWQNSFYYVVTLVKKNQQPRKNKIVMTILKKVVITPSSWIPLIKKISGMVLRKVDIRRRGVLIALVGVNGAGKSTLSRKTLDSYKPLSRTVNGQHGYYFGWKPFLNVTKVISSKLKRRKKKVFQELNKPSSFSWYHEAFFIYNYIEYLLRYIILIWPQLRNRKLVICDRYFYDLYGQYTHAPKSLVLWLLFYLYPRPDFLFILDADLNILLKRGKVGEQRVVKHTKDLEGQRKRYEYLRRRFRGTYLDTSKPVLENVQLIIDRSWRRYIFGKIYKAKKWRI
jgi:thymidylate kinase